MNKFSKLNIFEKLSVLLALFLFVGGLAMVFFVGLGESENLKLSMQPLFDIYYVVVKVFVLCEGIYWIFLRKYWSKNDN
ncbi:MAG: hypothetical protein K6G40_05320 [Eubacterium sp.]|nr:hypothetical protein [Eubacterium sp.]